MATHAIPSAEFRSIQQELRTLSTVTVTNQNKNQVAEKLLNLKNRLADFTSRGSGIGGVEILQCKQELDRINDAFLRSVFASIKVPEPTSYGAPSQPRTSLPTPTKQELDLKGFQTDKEIDRIFKGKSADALKAFFNTVEPGWPFINCMQGINSRADSKVLFRELLDTVLRKYYYEPAKRKEYFDLDNYTDGNRQSPRTQAMFAFTRACIHYALEQIPAGCANLLVFFSNTNTAFMTTVICDKAQPFLETLTSEERKKFLQWAKENENAPNFTDRTPYYKLLMKEKN